MEGNGREEDKGAKEGWGTYGGREKKWEGQM